MAADSNPQRIEQRIGRCHRYGQKHDVVVVNFLNRKNEADQCVFQSLSEKIIFLMRGQKTLLERDLAALYGVETRVLNQAVRRNRDHFPADFMFELSREEAKS